jgi:hypothetical protein
LAPKIYIPKVIAARQEMEERRKEKHRKMEVEREKMRDQIRNKYSLHKKVFIQNLTTYIYSIHELEYL